VRRRTRPPQVAACAWRVYLPSGESVTVAERSRPDGRTAYVVVADGLVASEKGEWEKEPAAQDRDDAYVARTHHDLWDAAVDLAERMVLTPAPRP
jgi:hypothetical protein